MARVSTGWLVAAALLADGLAGLAGGLLSERWLRRQQGTVISFAAGALLAAAFLDLLPEALAGAGPGALSWAFAGFVALALAEWRLGHHHRGVETRAPSPAAAAGLLLGDALHNVGDGAAIALAFLVSPAAGVGVAVAVVVHEVPQEIGDYAVLRAAGYGKGRALAALACVQLTAGLGAAAALLVATSFRAVIGPLLSLAAGTFLYIGATDLLPELHAGVAPAERRARVAGFLGGAAVIVGASALV